MIIKTLPNAVRSTAHADGDASGKSRDAAQDRFGGVLADVAGGKDLAAAKDRGADRHGAALPAAAASALASAAIKIPSPTAVTGLLSQSSLVAPAPVAPSPNATGAAIASLADLIAALPAIASSVQTDDAPAAAGRRSTKGRDEATSDASAASTLAASAIPPAAPALAPPVPLPATVAAAIPSPAPRSTDDPADDASSPKVAARVPDAVSLQTSATSVETRAPSQTAAKAPSSGAFSAPSGLDTAAQAGDAAPAQAASAAPSRDAGEKPDIAPDNHDGASIVKSVVVETHFAPATTLPPIQQVVATVKELAASAAPSAALANGPATAAPTANQTLTLVLEPKDLGTVTIRLQLRAGSLDLQLDVANTQTLGLLTKDRDSLVAALDGGDHSLGTLTLQAAVETQASSASDNPSQSQEQGGRSSASPQNNESQNASQQSDGGSNSSGGASDGRGARREASRDESGLRRPRPSAASASSGIFV